MRTISRVGSCRFTAYYWLACALGLYAGGGGRAAWLAFTFFFWLVYCLATEVLNRITDQAEDAVNRPERTAMCTVIGFRRLRWLAAALYTLLIVLAVAWIAVTPTVALAALLTLNVLISYQYSRGLRLKARRRLGTVALMALVTTPLLTGWATGGSLSTLLDQGVPIMVVIALFFGGLVGIKDITDVAGDLKIGYSSAWVALATSRRRLPLVFVVALPFALLLGLVVAGVLPSRLAWLLTLVPLSAAIVAAAVRAASAEERSVAREAMYHHTAVFLAATLMLYDPSFASLGTGALGLVGWVLASRYLHWTRLVTRRSAEVWRGLLGNKAARSAA